MARADVPQNTPKSHRRRAELLVAAQSAFEERGYFDTRVADIARAAGVSHGTFYTYFDSKDDVLRELIVAVADDLFVAATERMLAAATPRAVLEASIRTFMAAYRDHAAMLRILEQVTACSPAFLEQRVAIRQRFGERLEAVLKATMPTPVAGQSALDPQLAAYALGGMVEDFARSAYLQHLVVDDETAIATLTEIWARAVGLKSSS